MKSTGPRTQDGKDHARLNAVKHGLTGHLLLLSDDERPAYEALCKSYRDLYKPVGLPEETLVQCIADDYFRALRGRSIEINQMRLIENVMYSKGPTLKLGAEKFLGNIALYLQRIERTIRNNTKALLEMQALRKAEEKAAQQAVEKPVQKAAKPLSANVPEGSRQFVYSPQEMAQLLKQALLSKLENKQPSATENGVS